MLGKSILIVGLIVALSTIFYQNQVLKESDEDQFIRFVLEHWRSYFSKDEYKLRLGIFTQNLRLIEELNNDPSETASYAVNDFADWTDEERKKIRGYIPSQNEE